MNLSWSRNIQPPRSPAHIIVFLGMSISIAIYQTNSSRSANTSSQKKRQTKKPEEKWEATTVTTLLKAAQTLGHALRPQFAICRWYFIKEISPPFVPPSAKDTSGVNVYCRSASQRQLKGHPWRSIIWLREWRSWHGLRSVERRKDQRTQSSSMECIIKIPWGKARTLVHWLPVLSRAPMILNYAGIAERSVPRPQRYLLNRAKNLEYGSFQARYHESWYQRRTQITLEPRTYFFF